jgi:hypothetical protein
MLGWAGGGIPAGFGLRGLERPGAAGESGGQIRKAARKQRNLSKIKMVGTSRVELLTPTVSR